MLQQQQQQRRWRSSLVVRQRNSREQCWPSSSSSSSFAAAAANLLPRYTEYTPRTGAKTGALRHTHTGRQAGRQAGRPPVAKGHRRRWKLLAKSQWSVECGTAHRHTHTQAHTAHLSLVQLNVCAAASTTGS